MTSESGSNLWRHSHRPGDAPVPLAGSFRAELLVVGAGFTGCSAALEAASGGANVAVLEAKTIGHGGSGRNVGLVNAGLWLPPDAIVKAMGRQAGTRLIDALSVAPEQVFRLIDTHGIDCEATRNGTLHLAHARSGLADLKDRFRQGKGIGAPLQLLDRAETARRTGSDIFHGSLFDPRAGTVQPLAYCRGLVQAARQAGARIFEEAPVSQIGHDGTDWIATVRGAEIRAAHLLLATNAYAEAIDGVPDPAFVPVHFSQFATAPLTDVQRAGILPGGEGCWDTDLVMSSLRLDREGRLIIGGVGDVTGPQGAVHRAWAARKLAQIYPHLGGTQFEHEWSGVIAMTSDHLPKVVSLGPRALSIYGYSGRGIGPGTVFGKAAARALLHGDIAALPVGIERPRAETFKSLRALYYEFGAVAVHTVRPSPFRSRAKSRRT